MRAARAALAAARAGDTTRRHDRVRQALTALVEAAHDITISSVARAAGVHRSFIYRHPELRLAVEQAQRSTTISTAAVASAAWLHTDLANAQAQNARLVQQIKLLENRLSDALGVQAHQASGIGAPDKAAQLEYRCLELEQRVRDLTHQLEERTDDLEAARVANRNLMTLINRHQS
ncbi:hypothetical protein Aph02nite_79360 [Actinoplanes philippinensis]|uniref:Uncharacterized protein n=1 Tax=Actinoplanes philippinensis TaxID=35752 RepID=A0A1I2KFJ3_9ACTN|nr:DUF6262 family protein [Actinoplanes philippinensis]GIE81986.1 hypothetical protein Aph02nite_79360 [Actinoplanes philippinensis]SFF65213.1 hypothetical protein SAMN05421541_116161 [Actinoplanes philippinensis]